MNPLLLPIFRGIARPYEARDVAAVWFLLETARKALVLRLAEVHPEAAAELRPLSLASHDRALSALQALARAAEAAPGSGAASLRMATRIAVTADPGTEHGQATLTAAMECLANAIVGADLGPEMLTAVIDVVRGVMPTPDAPKSDIEHGFARLRPHLETPGGVERILDLIHRGLITSFDEQGLIPARLTVPGHPFRTIDVVKDDLPRVLNVLADVASNLVLMEAEQVAVVRGFIDMVTAARDPRGPQIDRMIAALIVCNHNGGVHKGLAEFLRAAKGELVVTISIDVLRFPMLDASRKLLTSKAKACRFDKRRPIYTQGAAVENVYLVGAGRVRLARTLSASRTLGLGSRGAGELCAEETIAAPIGAIYHEHAEAVTEVEALAIPLRALHEVFLSDGDFTAALAGTLFKQRGEAEARIAELSFSTVMARLARFLCAAAERWGRPQPGAGLLISALFTHEELASLVGTTRETTTLTLGQLRGLGLIALDHRYIVVLDKAGLADLATEG